MLHLCLAVAWLILAVILLGMPLLRPGVPAPTIWDTGISLGWPALVLGLYNLARWWNRRSYQATLRQTESADRQRRAYPDSRTEQTPDPNFDFSDSAPPDQG
jgi:hypothetical protein